VGFWRADRRIDADLQNLLARVEKLEPVWKTEQRVLNSGDSAGVYRDELESGKIKNDPFSNLEYQEAVLKDTDRWRIAMTFVQNTPDGELETYVYSSAHFAIVNVALANVGRLSALLYKDGSGDVKGGPFEDVLMGVRSVPEREHRTSRGAVEHVREWVRRRVLPELEAARVQRDSTVKQRAEQVDGMRKKYLP
jgi:hypothetical protein